MITPEEIKVQCGRWWKEVLVQSMDGHPSFPKEINRIGKISSKDLLLKVSTYRQEIAELQKHSKAGKKHGYILVLEEKHFDKIGRQAVPHKIMVETLEDYLHITGKKKEFDRFQNTCGLIMHELPQLKAWIRFNPLRLIGHTTWEDTLKVCHYFLSNPKPGLYTRQLPIRVHTKYISEHQAIISQLLDFLIPDAVNHNAAKFEERYNLLFDESLIRLRFLDTGLSPIPSITYLSFTVSELNKYHPACKNIFVTENKMNFLTLPLMKDTLAIWSGGGFNVSYLKNIEWLKQKKFYYWGDIDAHGFQILHQFRTYFPDTTAVMMDRETLEQFEPGTGSPSKNQNLSNLSEEELRFYEFIITGNIRLEQEKISQVYAEGRIRKLLG